MTESMHSKDKQNGINELVWMTCYTAVDFHASLRFPGAADEPYPPISS